MIKFKFEDGTTLQATDRMEGVWLSTEMDLSHPVSTDRLWDDASYAVQELLLHEDRVAVAEGQDFYNSVLHFLDTVMEHCETRLGQRVSVDW